MWSGLLPVQAYQIYHTQRCKSKHLSMEKPITQSECWENMTALLEEQTGLAAHLVQFHLGVVVIPLQYCFLNTNKLVTPINTLRNRGITATGTRRY